MAVFPCDWSAHRYPGVQRSVYITAVFGEDYETHKLRLCQPHFRDELALLREHLAEVDENSTVGKLCDGCSDERAFVVYAKVFDQNAEPVYYAGDFCAECWDHLRPVLKVANGNLMKSL